MKYVVYTILFALLAVQVFSQEVDEKTASVVAERFFLKNYGTKASVENVLVKQYKGHESLFFCNMDKGGWVAVPANRNLNPVVAHSDEGHIDLYDGPDAFWDWMEQYEFVVDMAMQEKWHKEDRHKKWDELLAEDFDEQNVLKSYVDYTELLSTRWGQSETNDNNCQGYNYLMPENSSCSETCFHCCAGCLAVAVGQIMNYWGYATGGYANIEWWIIPNRLLSYSLNFEKEQYAVSYLFKRIGDRVAMDYCATPLCKSGANPEDAEYAFERFGYKDDMDYKKKKWYTYNSWVNILKTEILAERPVLYNYLGYHSFVCDGYKSDNDNFHFNLGARDNYNAWIDFEDISDIDSCVTCQNYTSLSQHTCLVNIRPNVSSIINLINTTISTSSGDSWAKNLTYQAKNYISVAGSNTTVTVTDSATCRLIAGDSIILKPGFHTQAGASLLCKVYKKPTLKDYHTSQVENFSVITYNDENSIDEISKQQTEAFFKILPNPAKNEITITLQENKEKDVFLFQIFNSLGVKMYEQKTSNSNIVIDISQYPKGQYIVNIKKHSKTYCSTFIKL